MKRRAGSKIKSSFWDASSEGGLLGLGGSVSDPQVNLLMGSLTVG